MRVRLSHEFRLECAHALPHAPEGHKCRRVHGHSFVVEVHVEGDADPDQGWLLDYGDLRAVFEPLRRELDHHLLNDIPGLENPTSEQLAAWIWKRLAPALPQLAEVAVRETPRTRCSYRGG